MLDEEKIQWLEWFIDLINFDYKQASPAQRHEVARDLIIGLAAHSYFGIDKVKIWGPQGVKKRINKTHALPVINPDRLLETLQNVFQEIMKQVETHRSLHRLGDPQYNIMTSPEMTISITLTTTTSDEGPMFTSLLRGASQEQSLLFHLLQVLDGVPLAVFKKCSECGKWFVHANKRKRRYCSRTCSTRSAVRKHRERLKAEDPQAYERMLEEARRRARESYVKKMKTRNPNARVESRPRKRKERID